MKHIIFSEEGEGTILRSHLLKSMSAAYLRAVVLPALRTISDDEYVNGPLKILGTPARFSYVLDVEAVCGCVEWEPGLVVVRFAPDKSLAYAEIRSPNPRFGGREVTRAEIESYDDSEENSQYASVFDAWDTQFDDQELQGWQIVDADTKGRFEVALAHVQMLGKRGAM